MEDLAEDELYDMAASLRDVAGGIYDSLEVGGDDWAEDDWSTDEWADDDWDQFWDDLEVTDGDWDTTTTADDTWSTDAEGDYSDYDWYYDYSSWDDYSYDDYYYYYDWLSLSKAQTVAKDNSHIIAGVSFGVIGFASALALLATCNKKKIADNEQALLQ